MLNISRKLIVDEYNELFDISGMEYLEFYSEYEKIRQYAAIMAGKAPEKYQEETLLEQQYSELIKNAIKHGNKKDRTKKVRVWYSYKNRIRFIVEDEGEGFKDLEKWNEFYQHRYQAMASNDFEKFLSMARYVGPDSQADDGGNSLIAAIEYWNGGIIFNKKKNKIGVQRWIAGGSIRK